MSEEDESKLKQLTEKFSQLLKKVKSLEKRFSVLKTEEDLEKKDFLKFED